MDDRGAEVERLREALVAAGLEADAERILDAALPSVRLVLTAAASADAETTPPPGTTRCGGSPDRPADAPWPHGSTSPLSFLGQLDLGSLRGAAGLPDAGLLAFYYDMAAQPWDSTDGPGWWVEHLTPEAPTTGVDAPDGSIASAVIQTPSRAT